MAATNFTPISLYYTTTAAAAPVAGNLVNGELAINITDGKLYYKDNAGVVKLLASQAGAIGTVSSVAQTFTGGIISVAGSPITTSGTLALTVAGTSGGVPYFTSASTWASSAALAANALVIGGGAGLAPATTTTGTGVVTALGVNVGTAGAFVVNGGALGTPSSGTVTNLTGTASININGTVGGVTPASGNFTTVDTTNIEVTNIKAKDGTAAITIADSTGIVTGSTAQIISVTDNTNAALRITQLGTGNALLVEDSANPDSTPFVIDTNGLVIRGYTASITIPNYAGNQTPNVGVQTHGTTIPAATFAATAWIGTTGSNTSQLMLNRSAGVSVGSNAAVASGYTLGAIGFSGDDGTQFVTSAAITAVVDGTPGTNDMPGRLVFSTTADGASSPTERMRINNAGQIGIGTGSLANQRLRVQYNVTDPIATQAIVLIDGTNTLTANNALIYGGIDSQAAYDQGAFNGTISLNSGGSVRGARTFVTTSGASGTVTAASGFLSDVRNTGAGTLTNAVGFNASFFANSGGGTLTNAYGFYAAPLTAATNNYGFHSNLAATTGAYNFYAAGTADNYFAGKTVIGNGVGSSTSAGDTNLMVWRDATGAVTTYGVRSISTVQSSVTTSFNAYETSISTSAAAFTLPTLRHFVANRGTIGAGSTVTNQYGFVANSSLTGATNNYGFFGDIAAAAGRYNFYAAGTANNYFAGNVLIGTTASQALSNGNVAGNLQIETGSSAANMSIVRNTVSATGPILIFGKSRGEALGSRAAVVSGDTLGNIVFDGADGTNMLDAASIFAQADAAPATGSMPGRLVFSTSSSGSSSPTERMRIDSSGNVGIGTSSPVVKLGVVGSAIFSGASPFISLAYNQAGTTNSYWQLSGGGVATLYNAGTGLNGQWSFVGGAGSEFMRIDSSGNVGIGTSSPAAKLSSNVSGAGSVTALNLTNDNSGFAAGAGPAINFGIASSSAVGSFGKIEVLNQTATIGSNSYMAFFTRGGDVLAERMRIDSSGNVGIGTASPGSKLDIGGTVGIGLKETLFLSAYSTNTAQFRFVWQHAGTGLLGIGTASDTNGSMIFGLAGSAAGDVTTEWMRIDTSGKLGLGVAPSAWTNSTGVIQGLGGWSLSSNGANSNSADFLSNAYRAGGVDSFTYLGTSTATRYKQFQGQHQWYNAPSGTAGTGVVFTQAMTLDASGNLGIGTSSPGAKLEVNGAIADVAGNVRSIPQNAQTSAYVLTAADNGKHVAITTGGVTVNISVFSVGQTVVIFNNSASSQTITQGTSVTMYLAGTATTGNRTLAQRGLATILCVAANTFTISGSGLT